MDSCRAVNVSATAHRGLMLRKQSYKIKIVELLQGRPLSWGATDLHWNLYE